MRHKGVVTAVAFSPDGKTVLTGSWDGTARLWDVPPPAKDDPVRLRLSVEVRTGYTTDEAIGQNGFFLLSADGDVSQQQLELLRYHYLEQSEPDNRATLVALKKADNNRTLPQKILVERLQRADVLPDVLADNKVQEIKVWLENAGIDPRVDVEFSTI